MKNAICNNIYELRGCHTDRSKSERQMSYDITYMWTLKKNDKKELIYKI